MSPALSVAMSPLVRESLCSLLLEFHTLVGELVYDVTSF